jgi:hypothetical protein
MKKLMFAKKKKWNKTTAKNKLDKLFSLKVREFGRCYLQGKDHVNCGGVLQTAHIIGRGNLFLRWDFRNALCICSGHHVYYTYHPEFWRSMMVKYVKEYTGLLKDQQKKITFNQVFYEEKLKELI